MTERRTVRVELAGSTYKMSSDADEARLQQLASMVNERVATLGDRAKRTATPAQMMAVVALGLADDLLASEERRHALEHLVRKTLDTAIERIDVQLESPTFDKIDEKP